MRRAVLIGVAVLVPAALVTAVLVRHPQPAPTAPPPSAHAMQQVDAGPGPTEDEDKGPLLRPPSGKLAALTCANAAAIVAEVRQELAFDPVQPTVAEMAASTKDWVDPHGHWAVAPDATPYAVIDAEAGGLLGDIARGTACDAAARVGASLAAWIDAERVRYDAREAGAYGDAHVALTEPIDGMTHDGGVTQDIAAKALTDELASRAGALDHTFGEPIGKYLAAARNRFFPSMNAQAWSEVVLAAAVRGWVELVDAHGAWAPYGEEAAVHDVDLDQDAPSRLWLRATRTLLGVRIDEGPMAPLEIGDVVLEVDGLMLAGLGVEQLDELALTATDSGEPFDVVLMREGDRAPRTVRVDPQQGGAAAGASAHPFDLAVESVPYGGNVVLVVTVPDVYDDLGELFTRALQRARAPSLAGIVLDLRGNGGGSTEGAIETLGALLPGARLFPMRSKSGAIETDRAPTPPADERWEGPVATLVDYGTASAAEMLAGALAAYRRGPSVGTPTYGKGCAQEYLDDDAHAGLLRVTTLLFSLPDGSPVQRIGLTPTIPFAFGAPSDEREAKLVHSPASWTGPDVRDREWLARSAEVAWPSSSGHVGPCRDTAVCRALALLGEPRNATGERVARVRGHAR